MIQVPTVAELSDQVLADIEGVVGQRAPILPKAFLRVLSRAIGGALALLYRLIRWTYQQIFPATAEEEALLRIGAEYGLGKRGAVTAVLDIQIVGDDDTEVPGGTIWIGNNGLTYSQLALAVIESGLATARVECLQGGVDGTLGIGNTLAVASPLGGISGASVTAIVSEGEDEETVEQFRARVMQRIAGQPQGGSAADYVKWAMEIPGIIKAFAFRTDAGEVTVYPLQATTGAERIPISAKITEVQTYISSPARKPLCADVLAAAMTEKTVNITITTLSPNDAATKDSIQDAMERYLYAAYPKQYPDEQNPTNLINVAAIWAAILAAGAAAASVTMTVAGTGEVTSYGLGDSELVTLGTIQWA